MEIEEGHKALLRGIGLKEEDFALFDGRSVTYEYDGEKGVRLYDPDYLTSYNEYIEVDGWSAWSSELDTFMTEILSEAKEKAREREEISPRPSQEEIASAMKKKFGKPE